MAQTTHESNISLTMLLESSPISRAGLGTTCFFAVDCFPSDGAFDGERVAEFGSAEAIKTAVEDGDLAHDYFDDLADSLGAQSPAPFPFKIALVDFDDTNGEDYDADNPADLYANAYAEAKAADPDFYGVGMDISRDDVSFALDTDADVEGHEFMYALAKSLESDKRVFTPQTANADWLADGPSNTLVDDSGTGIVAEDLERTGFVYHDSIFDGDGSTSLPDTSSDSRAFLASTWLARALSFDPDEQSSPWDLDVSGVPGLEGDITETERADCIDNGANIGLPYGPASLFVDPGQNAQGRAFYEIVSSDWFYFRVLEDTIEMKVDYSSRGEKVPLNKTGQNILRSIVTKRLQQGVRNGHFLAADEGPEDYEGPTVSFPEITSDDRDEQRLRCEVSGRFTVSARKFDFTVEFTR